MQHAYVNKCKLHYLTGSFKSKTNIPVVSELASLGLAALLVQEYSGLLLESFLVLQDKVQKGQTVRINMQHSQGYCNFIHIISHYIVPTQQAASIGAIGCQINQYSTAALPHLGSWFPDQLF